MNNLYQYKTKGLSALQEGLDELDLSAKEELDGIEDELDSDMGIESDIDKDPDVDDMDIESDVDQIETDMDDIQRPERPETSNPQEYNVNHVVSQLDGMVEHWFKLAQEMEPDKKENFLKLGERLSEITDVLNSEFLNG